MTLYNKKALIEAFVGKYEKYIHEDFTLYHKRLLEHLEKAFGVDLTFNSVVNKRFAALWMLLQSSAIAYLSAKHPLDGYLEAGLIEIKIDDADQEGWLIRQKINTVGDAKENHRLLC